MKKLKIACVVVFLAASAFLFTRSGSMQTNAPAAAPQVKTAAEVYKNIQVLKDMPADQLDRVMAIFSGALGVKCSFCHVPGQFEKDDKEEKKTAREMIRMTMAINKDFFEGHTEVSCATCHAGRSHPQSLPPLNPNAVLQAEHQHGPPATKEVFPTGDEVFAKYAQALGGQAAVDKVKTRYLKGSRVTAEGTSVPEEVYWKGGDHIFVTTTYPQGALSSGFSGGGPVWASTNQGNTRVLADAEAEQSRREAQIYDPSKLRAVYKDVTVTGSDKVNNKDVWVVRAVTTTGGRERLYFDKQSGLLVRRMATSMTVIGPFPFQADYSDYKPVDGVMVPMTVTWVMPGRSWSRKITEVKQNVAIDDAKFERPAVK